MEDIVLINPPQIDLHQPRAYIPLGLAYIGGALEAANVDVKVLNLADETNLADVDYPDADIRVNEIAPGFFDTTQNHFLLFEQDDRTLTPRGNSILAHNQANKVAASAATVTTMSR